VLLDGWLCVYCIIDGGVMWILNVFGLFDDCWVMLLCDVVCVDVFDFVGVYVGMCVGVVYVSVDEGCMFMIIVENLFDVFCVCVVVVLV